MKTKNFNKIGDTSFRVKNQVKAYSMVLEWLSGLVLKSHKTCLEINEIEKNKQTISNEFIAFCKKEQIYRYDKNTKNINRFGFIFGFLKNKINFFNTFNDWKEFKKIIHKNGYENFWLKMLENYPPFKKMLQFLTQQKNDEEININNLFLAFACYDEKETFDKLYKNEKIIEEICTKNLENYIEKIKKWNSKTSSKEIMQILQFRKPPNIIEIIKKILKYIDNKELNEQNKKILVFQTPRDYKIIIKNWLNQPINKLKLIRLIYQKKTEILLLKEYKDLFKRWVLPLNLLKNIKKELYQVNRNLKFENGFFVLLKKDENISFPFEKNECEIWLKNIQKNNWEFKFKKDTLKEVPNSAVAEYLVNLYVAYQKGVNSQDFRNSCNTIMNDNLEPIFTAPGKQADMEFFDKNTILVIETSIIKNVTSFIENEVMSNLRHLDVLLKKTNETNNIYFLSVSGFKDENMDKIKTFYNSNKENYENVKNKHIKWFFLNFKDLTTFTFK